MRILSIVAAIAVSGASYCVEDDNRRLRFNQEGALENGDTVNEQGCYEDRVSVDLDNGPAVFRLHSESFDPNLRITGPDGTVYQNDDLGSGHDSGLDITVKMPGSFEVFVSSANEGEQGAYRLSVQGMRLAKREAASPTPDTPNLDRIQLASGHAVAGHAKFGVITLATVFGSLQLPTDRLVSIKRDAAGLATVQLNDGSQVQGTLDGEAIELKVAGGSALSLPLREISSFSPADGAEKAKPSDTGKPWIVLGDSRLIGSWTAPRLTVASGFGSLSLPVERIAVIQPPSVEHPLGYVALQDGSFIHAAPSALPMQMAGFSKSPPLGVAVTAQPTKRDAGVFVLTLTSGDELVGAIGDIVLMSPFGKVAVGAKQIATLQADSNDPDVLTLTLVNGERVFGKIEADVIPFTWSWGEAITIPRAAVLSGTTAAKGEDGK